MTHDTVQSHEHCGVPFCERNVVVMFKAGGADQVTAGGRTLTSEEMQSRKSSMGNWGA